MADFTPTWTDWTDPGPFRFWAQKVLPLEYDDSLSYYEVLCKVVSYLNTTITNVAALGGNVEGLRDAYTQLQQFVNDYFDNLDVQQEINAKLDNMAETGALTELLQPFIDAQISTDVTSWLERNITPTSPAVDASLTIEGAAADAKKTGDEISDIRTDLGEHGFFTPTVYTGDLNDVKVGWSRYSAASSNKPSDSTGYVLTIQRASDNKQQIAVDESQNLYTRRLTGTTWYSWAQFAKNAVLNDVITNIGSFGYFTPTVYADNLNDIKVGWSRYSATASYKPSDNAGYVLTIQRASNAKQQIAVDETQNVYVRLKLLDVWKAWRKIPSEADLAKILENFENYWNDISDSLESGVYRSNVAIGAPVNPTRSESASFVSAIIPCKSDDVFKITGTGGDSARLYAFCDGAYNLISKSGAYITVTDFEITAPKDGYLIVNIGKDDAELYKQELQIILPKKYADILDNFTENVTENIKTIAKTGGNWSSDIIPDNGSTTEYAAISSYNPTLQELYAAYDALVAAYPNYITKTDLGLDQSGEYHLYKYSFIPESITVEGTDIFSIPSMPKILLGSGTHGNGQDAGDAPEMVVGVYYLFKNICDNWYGNDALTYLRHHVHIELIPVQNPWGYVNKSRRNSRQVDINSNFPVGWREGTQGTNTYGGTAPLSEAESVIIKNFIEANTDALFYFDLHTTGGTQTQEHMIYYSMVNNDNLIVTANDTVIYLSDKWNHENIENLNNTIMHGYVHSGGTGRGEIYQWVNSIDIPACVMEAFPNFENSGLDNNSALVMRMCQEELVTFIIKSIRYFKFNYLAKSN